MTLSVLIWSPKAAASEPFSTRRRRNPPQHLRSVTFCESSGSQAQTNRTSKPRTASEHAHKQSCTHPRVHCEGVLCSLIDQKEVAAVAFGLLLPQPPVSALAPPLALCRLRPPRDGRTQKQQLADICVPTPCRGISSLLAMCFTATKFVIVSRHLSYFRCPLADVVFFCLVPDLRAGRQQKPTGSLARKRRQQWRRDRWERTGACASPEREAAERRTAVALAGCSLAS